MTHLWEAQHDYYGGADDPERLGSLAELDDVLTHNGYDGANFPYRWDWEVPDPELNRDGDPEVLVITFVSPRRGHLWGLEVAVTRDQEAEVRALLERHLVPWLKMMWAPLLDEPVPENGRND